MTSITITIDDPNALPLAQRTALVDLLAVLAGVDRPAAPAAPAASAVTEVDEPAPTARPKANPPKKLEKRRSEPAAPKAPTAPRIGKTGRLILEDLADCGGTYRGTATAYAESLGVPSPHNAGGVVRKLGDRGLVTFTMAARAISSISLTAAGWELVGREAPPRSVRPTRTRPRTRPRRNGRPDPGGRPPATWEALQHRDVVCPVACTRAGPSRGSTTAAPGSGPDRSPRLRPRRRPATGG